ncbi:MAG: CBS domain-containing protein [Methanosarcinales archaeon Met12]|nr:MAG: CBS domain-containing protein [Methanosarcinales archaeon Met12]
MSVKVEDIMVKDVVCATVPGSRDDVLALMKRENISGVPVVKGKKLIGIVTRKDIFKHPEEEQIALLMSRNPISISPEASIVDAAKQILNNNIRRLPVVTGHTLVGIITVVDLMGAIANMNLTEPIEDYAQRNLLAMWDETPLPVALEILRLGDVDAASVLDAKRDLVGIISHTNLIVISDIEDSVEMSDMSAGSDDNPWTWESIRDTMSLYYGVSHVKLPDVPVNEVMTKEVITAFHHSEISDCARKMYRARIEQMPVITADNKLIGLLRDVDLLRVLIE